MTIRMKFSEAIDQTLKHYSITGKDLSVQSGVAEASISRFRRGERDIQAESLERLINSLPPQAQQYFYLNCLVNDLDDEAIATLLHAISLKMRSSSAKVSVTSLMSEKIPALT
jgi:transcriptional regulator with XRE-family HTH domain